MYAAHPDIYDNDDNAKQNIVNIKYSHEVLLSSINRRANIPKKHITEEKDNTHSANTNKSIIL